jgi:2-polyprenyl-3-methyl-5-hydroxy-6-metoxy-1,4-benzoquinol methylase
MRCRACHSNQTNLHTLGKASVAGYKCDTREESITAPLFDISLIFCDQCNLVSQRQYPEADQLLKKLYAEHESTQHSQENPYFDAFSSELARKYSLSNESKFLEIGCNCGTFLSLLRKKTEASVFGIEPAKTMKEIWKVHNLFVINEYMNASSVSLLRQKGPFDVIYFRHVFEHIPDPIEFIRLAQSLLSENGAIVLESPYLESIFKYGRHETMSYSHLNQYCVKSLDAIFKQFNMGLSEYELVDNDGGSIVAHFKRNIQTESLQFENDLKQKLINFLGYGLDLKKRVQYELMNYNKNEVIGYGAGAKGQHLIHMLGLDKFISYVVDDTSGFAGKFIPGTPIEIVNSDKFGEKDLKAVINLAPTHLEVIKKKVPIHLKFLDFINE